MKKVWIALVAMVGLTAAPSFGAVSPLKCLVGTDPSVAGDVAQIIAVRNMIDASCICSSFDGTAGKKHANYVKCAADIITAQAAVPPGNLRSQCKGTVKKFYAQSTCGLNPAV
ncbi:MAG: hypothetical protein HY270_08695, partial [Deltaproteobacteria bacterium]|nr:hypothetical protein [Deltaproteobacteria bacterium]